VPITHVFAGIPTADFDSALRAGNALLTLIVDDLDGEVDELAQRGIELGSIDTVPGAVRRTSLTDLDGSRITIGQPLGPGH